MPDYTRWLKLPAYTRLLGRARRERLLEPAFYDVLNRRLPELERAATWRGRLLVRVRFHWDVLRLTLACLPLSATRDDEPSSMFRDLVPTSHDVRSALRVLWRHPRLTSMVVLTLGLGIGANTAVFGAIRGVLLRSLPYPDAPRLVHMWATWPGGSGNLSYPDYRAILEEGRAFDAVAAYESWGNVALAEGAAPQPLSPNFVTPSYLRMLGARAHAGRLLDDTDNAAPGGSSVVLISYALWLERFGGDTAIVGRVARLNGEPFTIVGVVTEGFHDLARLEAPPTDIWLPTEAAPRVLGQPPLTDAYRIYWGLARLRTGVSLAQARAELAAVARRMEQVRPETHRGFHLEAQPLSERLRGSLAGPTLLLSAGAALLLLIGCANAANLLLARTTDRRRELAVRRALGASESVLRRQILLECVCLAGLGGILGIVLAAWATSAMRLWIQAHVSSFVDVSVDGSIVAVSAAASLATAILFGLAPAHAAQGGALRGALASGARGSDGTRGVVRRAILAAEVCVCVVLLAGAGLMIRSLEALTSANVGYATQNLITLRLELSGARYATAEARTRFAEALVEQANAVPDIASTTLWGPSVLGNATWVLNLLPAERPATDPTDFRMTFRHSINPGALANLGLALRAGREFTVDDGGNTPLVGIISESVAREFWPAGDAIGKRLKRPNPSLPEITVVGVAADALHRRRYSLEAIAEGFGPGGLGPQRDIYFPYSQRPNNSLTLAVRARTTPARAIDELQRIVLALDRDLPLTDIQTLDDRLAGQDVAPAAITALLTAYAVLALLLTVLGLYGVLAHSVAQRTREIGIRVALGANAGAIRRMVFLEGLRMTLAGAACGTVLALATTRFMGSLLFDVAPTDPWTFATVIVLIVGLAGLVMQIPLRRAVRVDPVIALRCE